MKQIAISISLFLAVFIIGNCGNKMPLPSVTSNPESFGANDTSYNKIATWNATELGYSPMMPFTPVDISIGSDGYIFVADSANNRILTLSESGMIMEKENLNTIYPVQHPIGVAINEKLNLLIVNGTNKIYVWNQYLNNIGVDSIITGISADTNYIFSGDAAKIDSITKIHLFYEDPNPTSSFQGIAFGPANDNTIFVTDNGTNRILMLSIDYSGGVLLSNGSLFVTFHGNYLKDIATFGSGAGTVDNPQGITADDKGNIYFTQLGGNFFVQKLKPLVNNYVSAYTLYENPIMDLNRFTGPHDVALGENDAIFVADTKEGVIYKFQNTGNSAGNLANLGKEGLAEATFAYPRAIAVSDKETVYIADSKNNRIETYQHSVSETDLPDKDRP